MGPRPAAGNMSTLHLGTPPKSAVTRVPFPLPRVCRHPAAGDADVGAGRETVVRPEKPTAWGRRGVSYREYQVCVAPSRIPRRPRRPPIFPAAPICIVAAGLRMLGQVPFGTGCSYRLPHGVWAWNRSAAGAGVMVFPLCWVACAACCAPSPDLQPVLANCVFLPPALQPRSVLLSLPLDVCSPLFRGRSRVVLPCSPHVLPCWVQNKNMPEASLVANRVGRTG